MLEVARLVLAMVFLVAGLGKLADPEGGRSALRGFGLGERLAAPAAVALAVAEILIGAALIAAPTAHAGAGGALVLLVVMLAATARALARGRAPSCHCFGALHSAPVSRSTLARIVALAGLAAVVGLRPAGTASAPELVIVAAAAIVVLEGVALLRVLRRYGRALARIDELERSDGALPALHAGVPAPAFALADLGGVRVSLEALLSPGLPVLLVFVDPLCGPCRELAPRLGQWQGELAGRVTLAVISGGERDDVRRVIAAYGLRHILLRDEGALAPAYGELPTPAAIAIAPDATIMEDVAVGGDGITRLVESLAAGAARRPAFEIVMAGSVLALAAAPTALAEERQSEQDELAGLRAALDAALAAQASGNRRSISAARSKNQAGRSPAARRARARTRSRLQAERDEAADTRKALAALQLTAAGAQGARQHMLTYLEERERFLADLRRLAGASRRETPAVEQSAEAHLQTAYSHLASAVQLTSG